MPVVYIDVLFCVNLVINYIMLRAAGAICKNRPARWRTLSGAAVGAAYAIAVFFPRLGLFYTFAFKLLACALVIAVSFPIYGPVEFAKLTAAFYGVTAGFGGLSFALCFMTGWGARLGAVYSNGIMYFDIPITSLLLGAVAFYGLLGLCSHVFGLWKRLGARRRLVIELGGKTAVLTALADTGNILVDPISHAPVIVAELDALKTLFDYGTRLSLYSENLQSILDRMTESGLKPRLIPFNSVGEGEGMMVGFVPDTALVSQGHELRPMGDCVVGVYPKQISSDKSYNALYNPN